MVEFSWDSSFTGIMLLMFLSWVLNSFFIFIFLCWSKTFEAVLSILNSLHDHEGRFDRMGVTLNPVIIRVVLNYCSSRLVTSSCTQSASSWNVKNEIEMKITSNLQCIYCWKRELTLIARVALIDFKRHNMYVILKWNTLIQLNIGFVRAWKALFRTQ